MRLVLHIDLNAFFAQVEINRNPSLKGKPVAVGGGVRGVVSTCSYEARHFGVHSGMPLSDAYKHCPDIIMIPGDYHEYSRQSHLFFDAVREIFPRIQKASIDECYADATEFFQDISDDEEAMYERLFDVQMKLLRRTSLKCSMGLGHTKFMAKMGSDYKKPLGITFLLTPQEWQTKIWPLAIGKMYGIGEMTAPKLEAVGITTIGELATTASEGARKVLGSNFDYLVGWANGLGSDVVSTESSQRKSCSNDVTLNQDTTDYDELRQWLVQCAEDVARQIRREGLVTRTVCIKLRDNNFYTETKRETFEEFTDSSEAISFHALKIFDAFYRGQPIRLCGVSVEDLVKPSAVKKHIQLTLNEALADGGDSGETK